MLICYDGDGIAVFEDITAAAYRTLGLIGEAAAELVFADENEIQAVNRRQRNIDKPTDVLSFPSLPLSPPSYPSFDRKIYPVDFDPETGAVFIGSIMICKSIAARQAEEYGHSAAREESYLFVHGLLHLLGFDHETETEKALMRGYEEKILENAR